MTRKPLFLIGCLTLISILNAKGQAPVADFSASVVAGCGPLGVNFRDLSTGSPLFWTWDFGNGQISNQQNPVTTYGAPGVYTVTLIVKNRNGENSVRKTDYITVYPYPTASFSANLTLACAPANIQFFDHSVPGQGSISAWNWDFGDGTTSPGQNPVHNYLQPGYYTVKLVATNSQGCSNTLTLGRYIRVVSGVQPDFAWSQTSTSCSAPFLLNFTNQTSGPGNLTYSWNLGNGSTPVQANPSTSYPANTDYKVSLTATSDLGCSQTIQKTVSFPPANPAITSPDSACTNTPIPFQNSSAPTPVSSLWNFGDGSSATTPNPSKTYTAASTYTVKVVNTYAACADSISKLIHIIDNPTANFTAVKTVTCKAPFTVNFTDQSTPATPKGWQWDFGDGSTSNQQNPSHIYTTEGKFDVKLTVTSSTGCTSTITKAQFIQIAAPTVTLDQLPGQTCTNTAYNPLANIISLDGVASYSWTATGATPATSTSSNPSFTYTTQGDYDLSLSITTNDGCTAGPILFSNAVIVGDSIIPTFTINPTTSCAHQPVTFTAAISGPVNYWFWYFGDGDTSQQASPVTHSYRDSGDFKVIMRVINHGCSTFAPDFQTVRINVPIANFGYRADCADRHNIIFSDSSKIDLTKGIPTYKWDFGDLTPPLFIGSPPGSPPMPHTYPSYDTYNVTLIVNNGGCTDTIVKSVVVSPQAPNFTVSPDSVCRNANFTLTAVGLDTNFIKSYSWTVGTTTTSGNYAFTSTLADTGNYALSLDIIDINGCPYSSLPTNPHTLVVTGPAPKFVPTNLTGGLAGGCRNAPIFFTDQSTFYPGYPIIQWIWNFGDGSANIQTFTAPPYSHAYADTGSYPVFLTAHDAKGCEFTFPFYSVQITAPQAGFFSRDTGFYCPNAPLPFTDSSKGYNLSWLWDFGDGGVTSMLQNPTHSFPTSGQKYSVKLKVTDQVGCSDSLTRTNYITIQKPIAAFTIADSTTICPPLQTTFTPNGQFYDSLYWDFGDGTTSTLPNTTHFYNTYDTFYAKLILRGPGGCLDSATRRVFVLNPNAGPGGTTTFTYGPLTACDSVLTTFNITAPGYTRWNLLFGDGQSDSSQTQPVPHMYRVPFVYQPQLILQDPTGCIFPIGAIGGNIKVLGATPFFSIDRHEFCDSGLVNFSDFTITNDGILSKTWVFGDGTPDFVSPDPTQEINPSHDYTTTGILLPTLKVTTQSNCAENYTDTIRIHQTPHPVFTLANPSCITVPLQFLGNLTIPNLTDTLIWAWNFGDGQTSPLQDPVITYPKPGNYTVSLRTSVRFGCSDTTSQVIPAYPLPSIKGPAEISTPVGFPVTIPFTYSTNIISYSWLPTTDLSCTDCSNPVATIIFSTLYRVTVTDSNQCVSSDSIFIKTICNEKNYYIPNTFSPNGDGVNDVFYPRGKSLYNIQSMRVFNRWGQKVFERRNFPANTQAEGWDGTFNGQLAPVDAYVYIIEVICDNAQVIALKGDVTLIR